MRATYQFLSLVWRNPMFIVSVNNVIEQSLLFLTEFHFFLWVHRNQVTQWQYTTVGHISSWLDTQWQYTTVGHISS